MKTLFKCRKANLLFFILPIWIVPVAWASHISSHPDPVVTVNGSAISYDAYDREITQTRKQILRQGKPVTESQLLAIKTLILENMVDRELLYQESRKAGILVKTVEVEREYTALMGKYSDESEFNRVLKETDFTEETLKFQIEKTMARQKLIDRKILPEISVTEKEAKAFYDKNIDFYIKPEKVRARHILVQFDGKASEGQQQKALEKIKMIQDKIAAGEDFAALAEAYSECPSGKNGGDLGYFTRGQMVKPFEEAAFSLNPGEVSPIVQSEYGFHLIKVLDKQSESLISYDEIKDKIVDLLQQWQLKKEIKHYIDKLRTDADVRYFLP
jgi:peptidyl-prolyl cis-trans isomerase C